MNASGNPHFHQLALIASIVLLAPLQAEVQITEIMFHPLHGSLEPEPVAEEYIEITNTGPSPISLAGTEITSGVSFVFPGTSIAPGEFLVVAADPAAFAAAHPAVPGVAVLGPWTGKLSNSGETIRITDGLGLIIDEVAYADAGDWAIRVRGPLDLTHRGWAWKSEADGDGSSLELINSSLSNSLGRNWLSSVAPGGTPAAANSVTDANIAPIIVDPAHDPPIPRSSDTVTISCSLIDEGPGAFSTLFYRLDGASGFTSMAMTENLDGTHSADIAPQSDRTIVEFYIVATDTSALTRSWPAPARQTNRSFAQTTNALYQVDNSFDPFITPDPTDQPIMRVVMTDDEHDELDDIGNTPAESSSNAEMNATFISRSAEGIRVRYLATIRNRGATSRNNDPNNQLVKFRSDDRWDGHRSIKFNADDPFSQVLGSILFRRFGVETAEAVPVQLRLNGDNDAFTNHPTYGSYAMVESLDSDYTDNHWPGDSNGNLYQVRDDDDTLEEGQLQDEGPDQDDYRNTYFKKSNKSADDFSDLVALTDVLNNTPPDQLFAEASQHAQLSQWARMFAIDSILGNQEGGLVTAKGDDYALYSGVADPRFLMVPHDLDTLGAAGVTQRPLVSIFGYADVDGLAELFDDPEFMVLFYSNLLDLIENHYTHEVVDPIIDSALESWVSASLISDAKNFIDTRPAGILPQIPRSFSATTNLTITAEGSHHTPTGAVLFSGDFDASRTLSLFVNSAEATLDYRDGTWALDLPVGNTVLEPGLNGVVIRAFDGKGGSGLIVNEAHLNVWNDTGSATPLSGTLTGSPPMGDLGLIVRPDYVPGTPVLVRVELRDESGAINRNQWDATATLTSTRPDIIFTPDTVPLFNGRGSALVSVVGAGTGGASTILLPKFSSWRYLDDGTNQGTAWRDPGFSDGTWDSGDAELGYGDSSATEVGFVDADPGTSGVQKNATTYFRTTFDVTNPSDYVSLKASMLYDDGAIVYINGNEAFRTPNMVGKDGYDVYSGIESPDEEIFFDFPITTSLLVTGTNTIAVEVHQIHATSSDMRFNLELSGGLPGSDAGDFTLVANLAGRQTSQSMTSLGMPTPTTVSGTLPGSTTTWSGVVHVTGDVTIPVGHTLTIAPGTIVLIDGDSIPGSTAGTDIIVEGTLLSQGTAAQPVTFTASQAGTTWGQILFNQASPSSFQFTHLHRAGHAPGGGNTGRGRCFHILGSDVTFEDCSISDNFGKIGETNSAGGHDPQLTILRSHLARSAMGFETVSSGVLIEDCHVTEMLGIYREDGITDDDDAIYFHLQGSGQALIIRDTVVACTDDDGIDTGGGENVLIDGVISRDCFDKGISMFGGTGTITRTTLAGNDIGMSVKAGADAILDHVTISENGSIGLQNENKTGSDPPSFYTVTNSVVLDPDSVRTDYAQTGITFNYCILGEAWAFAGSANNSVTNPLFADAAGKDFHLSTSSPAINSGDPAAPNDPDGSRADMGRFPYEAAFDPVVGIGEIVWFPADGPYHLVDDVTIPPGVDLVILPGTAIYLDEGKSITVGGSIHAVGTETARIQINALPGAPFVADPAGNGSLPNGPPKSGGLQLVDSMSPDNIISYLDIGNAQDIEGSIGIIRSECLIDHVTFRDSHLRMLYTEDSSVIVQYCNFPDMFAAGESPAALGLDNVSEHINGIGPPPPGGHYIIRHSSFGTNKGHNDVIDVTSGMRPNPIVQIIGNSFAGSGDELLDLGGDVYVAENFFYNVAKDDDSSDTGYANAISTGDAGTGTTIAVARNIFWDVDHAINLKQDNKTIFENNSVFKIHPDFTDSFGNPSVDSVINLYIPTDTAPTPGAGAYASGNILTDLPRVFSGADEPGALVTPLEFTANLVDPSMADTSVGDGHLGQTVFDLGSGNLTALPQFLDPDNGDFRLAVGSPAAGTGPLGQDFGALTPGGIWIDGEPSAVTTETSATLTVGAPGIFGYRWRLNSGPWAADTDIGSGFVPPAATTRTATIVLAGLADGSYTVEVEGRNFAGDWQDTPTVSKTWTVESSLPGSVRLNEILVTGTPDAVEFFNPGTTPYNLSGHSLTDDPAIPAKQVLPSASVPAGGFLVIAIDPLLFQLKADGESLTLFAPDALTVLDSVTYGHQPTGYTLGRAGHEADWTLTQPTLGGPNIAQPTASADAVYICEWLANGEVALKDDFIELCNPQALPVDLSGLFLTDNPNSQPGLHQIPALSFIGPADVAAFTADTHFDFKLSSSTEQLSLLDSDGKVIDSVVYISQTTDFSEHRDSVGVTGFSRLPTPGQTVPAVGSPEETEYLRVLALFDDLRITEIMYDPVQGSDYEFIEFRNIGTGTLDLTGLRITDGVQFTFPAMTLAPGEYVLVVNDLPSFNSLYGSGLPVIGEYEGKLSNGGEKIVVALPEPYKAAVLRFTYDDAWYPVTDGLGKSLVFADPTLPVALWRNNEFWGASLEDGGSPAGFTVVASGFPAWLTAHGVTGTYGDDDHDGLEHLLEYVLDLDPNVPETIHSGISFDGQGHPVFQLPLADPARPDATIVIQAADIPVGGMWETIATRAGQTPWVGSAVIAGSSSATVTDVTTTIPADPVHFYQIRALLAP